MNILKSINLVVPYVSFILIEVSYQSYWWVELKINDLDFKFFSVGIFLLIITSIVRSKSAWWLSGMLSNAFGSFADMVKQLMNNNLIVSINTYLMLSLIIMTPVYFMLTPKTKTV